MQHNLLQLANKQISLREPHLFRFCHPKLFGAPPQGEKSADGSENNGFDLTARRCH